MDKPDFNFIPFKTIHLYIAAFIHDYAPLSIIAGNLIGNILLTIPIGILLISHQRSLGAWGILFLSIYIPVFIEVGQLLLHMSGYGTRTIDVDDVLLNTIGIWFGCFWGSITINQTFDQFKKS
jgi:glycopeptide antibiotics resistance protein